MKKALSVTLNGTTSNPYHRLGLRQNPFPQMAEAEHNAACYALQGLAANPIPNADYIRETLTGYFTEEFIQGCTDRFKPGEMVKFTVTWEE